MLKDAYIQCRDALTSGGIENADFEARCMIEHLTGYGRAAQLAHGDEPFEKQRELEEMTARRLQHEPLQYILGKWSFCGFDFAVGDGVLIPRDDTEVALGLCLDYLRGKKGASAIDLCSGSGAIAVALAKLTDCHMTALELSEKASYFLKKNIELNQAAVTPIKSDVMSCFLDFEDDIFDLIVSNPPYIK
ncbi:MAG: peptide chain release factor N(5)-glutamine methyltransferase, partial [Ruminococcus sp.]|nr:peptide chain release factor N(5)-glutamine methyltransferase [Ruminococcus sp.]